MTGHGAMSENHIVREGTTTFTRIGWGGTYTYADEATGESFDTGATVITDARRVVFERHQASRHAARETGQHVLTYTIAPGSRARAGHQRHRWHDGEIVVDDPDYGCADGGFARDHDRAEVTA